MDSGAPIWITQGQFGRALVNLTSRSLVEHAHGELNILFKLGGADTVFGSGDQELPLDDNSVLIFNPWMPHSKRANGDAPTLILSLLLDVRWFVETFKTPLPTLNRLFPHVREALTEDILLRANRLAACLSTHMASATNTAETFLFDLVDAITREYADPSFARGMLSVAHPFDYRIRNALTFMHQRAAENPKVGDIAQHVGLSHSRFYEQFRRCVGVSPQCYIDWVRMTIATRWLSNSERPLIEISNELGFNAHSHFTRFFTQRTGISPSQFRRQAVGVISDAPDEVPARDNVAPSDR
jgi:AraC-like DNA-binding protein